MSDDITKLVREATASVQELKTNNAEVWAKIGELAKQGESVKADALKEVEAAVSNGIAAVTDRVVDLEQQVAAGVREGKVEAKTLGRIVAESEQFKAFASGTTKKARIDVQANTITGQEGSPPENSDTLVAPMREPGIVPGPFRMLRIRDVVPAGTTSSNAVEFTREASFTNSAAETAEAATKPESAVTFELVTVNVRTIAHWLKLSRQVLDDAPMLQSYIDTRLRYGVNLREDSQFLNGNGTGQNISGMTNTGNFTAFTPASGDSPLDSLNKAKYDIVGDDYAPTAIIMNPADWGAIERETGTDNHYIVGDPINPIGPNLWGLPIVVSNAMTAGNFLMAAFPVAYGIWDRMGTVVEMSESDETNFQQNLITVRAEKRATLASYVPAATRYGALSA